MGSAIPKVVCPGCLNEMQLTMLEPSTIKGMQIGTYYCHECDADTKRDFKTDGKISSPPFIPSRP